MVPASCARTVLHELALIWTVGQVDSENRDAFMALRDLQHWAGVPREENGSGRAPDPHGETG